MNHCLINDFYFIMLDLHLIWIMPQRGELNASHYRWIYHLNRITPTFFMQYVIVPTYKITAFAILSISDANPCDYVKLGTTTRSESARNFRYSWFSKHPPSKSGNLLKYTNCHILALTTPRKLMLVMLKLKRYNQPKIIGKNVFLFWLLNMTLIWCKHVHRLELWKFFNFCVA